MRVASSTPFLALAFRRGERMPFVINVRALQDGDAVPGNVGLLLPRSAPSRTEQARRLNRHLVVPGTFVGNPSVRGSNLNLWTSLCMYIYIYRLFEGPSLIPSRPRSTTLLSGVHAGGPFDLPRPLRHDTSAPSFLVSVRSICLSITTSAERLI